MIGLAMGLMLPKSLLGLDFQSSRTLSLSQAGRGGALLNDTITLNPSMLGFQTVAALSGTYNWANNTYASRADADSQRLFNVSVVDGKNEYLSAGISFTRRPDQDMFHMAMAKRVSSGVSVGLSGKRYSTRSNALAANGQSVSGFDVGASASFAVPGFTEVPVQLGLTADNLIHKEADERYVGPRQIGLGVKVNLNQLLMVYADAVEFLPKASGATQGYYGGAEVALGSDFYIRGGLMGFREKGWSAGGGWVGPKLGVAYGYQNRRVEAERDFQHSVTMDIYM